TNTITFTGIVSGAGAFNKSGAGNVILANASNSYSGGTIINAGTLTVAADNRLGTVPTTAVASNVTINPGALSASTGFTISTNRGILLGSPQSTMDVQAGVVSFTGSISGSGTLNKTGPGVLDLLIGVNSYTGGTVIKNGRLDIRQDRSLGPAPTSL